MVEVYKDSLSIANKTVFVKAYVEMNDYNEDEDVDSEEIVDKILQEQEQHIFNSNIFGIFAKDVKKLFCLGLDNLYKGTIDKMLENMTEDGARKWNKHYNELYSSVATTEYKGKKYKYYIEAFITK